MSTFKDRLNEALILRDMTAAELARRSGVNEGSVSQYRKGLFKANQYNLEKMAKVLNVPISWLMGADIALPAPDSKGVKIPVLGSIAGGIPISAVTDILDYEEIPKALAKTGEFFALKIKGDSMAPRICDGDVVIVRQQETVENGEIAVVLVNNAEATVKKVLFNEDGISLVAWNVSAFSPCFYTKLEVLTKPVRIIGRVIEVRGKL